MGCLLANQTRDSVADLSTGFLRISVFPPVVITLSSVFSPFIGFFCKHLLTKYIKAFMFTFSKVEVIHVQLVRSFSTSSAIQFFSGKRALVTLLLE